MVTAISDYYYPLSLGVIIFIMMIFACVYSRRLQAKEIVTIASLSALIAIGRAVFFWIPAFKPVTALVFCIGSIFGPLPGAIIGVLGGFLSNFVFGQGPWSPFQMFAWAIVGTIGGFCNTNNKIKAMIIGFLITVFIYGPILNFASMLLMLGKASWEGFWTLEISGFPYDCIHGISTVVFTYFIWHPLRKKLNRLHTKYRILSREGYRK